MKKSKTKNPNISLRYQQVKDAKRFFKILQSPNFTYFKVQVKSIEEEKKFLRKNKEKIKNNTEHNFTIIFKNQIVGAIGIMIQKRVYIGEIGYFIDEKNWGKGIATKAVKLIEEKLHLVKINPYRFKRIEGYNENLPHLY